jgi:hypothetical protein
VACTHLRCTNALCWAGAGSRDFCPFPVPITAVWRRSVRGSPTSHSGIRMHLHTAYARRGVDHRASSPMHVRHASALDHSDGLAWTWILDLPSEIVPALAARQDSPILSIAVRSSEIAKADSSSTCTWWLYTCVVSLLAGDVSWLSAMKSPVRPLDARSLGVQAPSHGRQR